MSTLNEVNSLEEFENKHWFALGNKCGGVEGVRQVLHGHKEIILKDAVIQLFDKNGRRIPPAGLQASVCNPNTDFRLIAPEKIDYAERLQRLAYAFQLKNISVSPQQFEDEFNASLALIPEEYQLGDTLVDCTGIRNGVCLPLLIPQQVFKDYGKHLSDVLLPALECAYRAHFKRRDFTNYRHNDLEKNVTIISDTRHDVLIQRASQGNLVVPFFPNPLQGFSVHADREQMATLTPVFSLGGGVDKITALVMYPDVVAYGYKAPGNDFASLQWCDPNFSLCCWAYDNGLDFGRYDCLGYSGGKYSGSLSVLG